MAIRVGFIHEVMHERHPVPVASMRWQWTGSWQWTVTNSADKGSASSDTSASASSPSCGIGDNTPTSGIHARLPGAKDTPCSASVRDEVVHAAKRQGMQREGANEEGTKGAKKSVRVKGHTRNHQKETVVSPEPSSTSAKATSS